MHRSLRGSTAPRDKIIWLKRMQFKVFRNLGTHQLGPKPDMGIGQIKY